MENILKEFTTQKGFNLLDLSKQKKVLLVFLRHAGCVFCSETLQKLAAKQAELKDTAIILVCMSAPETISALADRWKLMDYDLLVDQETKLYDAVGIARVAWYRIFSFKVVFAAIKASFSGNFQSKIAGDPFRLSGTALMQNGRIIKKHLAQNAADVTDFSQICSI